MSLRVVVASRNPVKLGAVCSAFDAVVPDAQKIVSGIDADSGVRDQPMDDAETRRGAANRAFNARAAEPDADYWVGLEGGLDIVGDQLLGFAWMAVLDATGKLGEARTVTLPLPDAIRKLIDAGLELGDANDQVFRTVNSKQGGGAFGLLTDGLYTRESVYVEALVMAIMPLVNPVYSLDGC